MPLKRRAVDAGRPSIPCAHHGAIEGTCQKDALSTLGAAPVHELLVTPAIAAVLEGGKGEVHDRHGGNRGDDHEHGGQDVESGHDGHHPFRYKSSARHTMRTIFRSLRATGGARIAYREPHALRCEPKTERRTRGTSATRPGPRTGRGTHLSCAAARAYAGGARAPQSTRHAGTNTPYRAYCGFSIADCAAPSTELRKPQSDGEQMCAPARELAPCRRVQWFGTYPSRLREHHDR